MYTERDLILAKRQAFEDGFELGWKGQTTEWRGLLTEAEARYPLPKVTRPRVVQYPLYHWKKWRVIDGELQRNGSEDDSDEWVSTPLSVMTAARVRVLADLLANPTEEVDA